MDAAEASVAIEEAASVVAAEEKVFEAISKVASEVEVTSRAIVAAETSAAAIEVVEVCHQRI